jgi:hypothetical protein
MKLSIFQISSGTCKSSAYYSISWSSSSYSSYSSYYYSLCSIKKILWYPEKGLNVAVIFTSSSSLAYSYSKAPLY